jgi:hypothetical protein
MFTIFDKKFYSETYNVPIEKARDHYINFGKRNNYLASEKSFKDLYPNFSFTTYENKYDVMKKHHEEHIKKEIFNLINRMLPSNKTNKEIEEMKKIEGITIAVCIHVGNMNIFLEDLKYYKFLSRNFSVDFYISIIEDEMNGIDLNTISKFLPHSSIIIVKNKGLDIGGFFQSLIEIKQSEKKYKYIYKTHTKSVEKWRKDLLLVDLYKIIKCFQEDEKIGIIGNKEWLLTMKISANREFEFSISEYFKKIEENDINFFHLNYLYKKFYGQENKLYLQKNINFIAGTIFFCRFELFNDWNIELIRNCYEELNDENSLDINWFSKVHGKDIQYIKGGSYSPNCIHKMKYPETLSPLYRDGMIEHAWERFFSIMCIKKGYKIIGIEKENLIQKYNIQFTPIIFPQFHQIPENDKFWGEGFTEWTLLKNHIENKDILQPHSDIGYYDLTSLNHRKKISYLTDKYKIDSFCIYHYWFGHQVMYKPAELMLLEGHPNKPYFFTWANESWERRWSGIEGSKEEILLKQNYENEEEHFLYLLPFFQSEKYVRIEGKPVFGIYRLNKDILFVIDYWNDLAKKNGLEGVFFISVLGHFKDSNDLSIEEINKEKIQGCIEFQPGYIASRYHDKILSTDIRNSVFYNEKENEEIFNEEIYLQRNPDVNEMIQKGYYKNGEEHYNLTGNVEKIYRNYKKIEYDTKKVLDLSLCEEKKCKYQFKGIFSSWNNTPRKSNPSIFTTLEPEEIEEYLMDIIFKIIQDPNPEINMILINAWNEWNEGAVLEPSQQYGYKYLEILNKVKEFFS